jgi:type IV secretion system protein VirB11
VNDESPQTAFINEALKPLRKWLDEPQVVEIIANQPKEIFVERLGATEMERFEVDQLTQQAIQHLAERVAAYTNQSVNHTEPLLSGTLPGGERFQAVLPPATTKGGAFAIRKQAIKELSLGEYRQLGSFKKVAVIELDELTPEESALCELLDAGDIEGFIRKAVVMRVSMLLSGGTSSGKTTFLNAILKEVPKTERIVTIEDTRELNPIQPNFLPLVASKGGQGQANVTIESLLQAAMRLRPDRLFLGEIRGGEAYSFLRAINTGHPGSITTVHADNPQGAFEQISLMVLQAGVGLKKAEVMDYIKLVLPIVIQQNRIGGWRGTTHIHYAKMDQWRAMKQASQGKKHVPKRAR